MACNGLVMPLPALETVHTSFGAAGLWAVIIAFATAVVVASVVAACLVCLRPLFRVCSDLPCAYRSSVCVQQPPCLLICFSKDLLLRSYCVCQALVVWLLACFSKISV